MPSRSASAHPISLSSTIVDVTRESIVVEIEIMLEDLVLIHQLKSDGELVYAANDLRVAAEKHREFVLKHFSILDPEGNRLSGRVDSLSAEQIDAAGTPQSELMRRSIAYKLTFELKSTSPKLLTFVQTFGGSKAALPALMDLHVLQSGNFMNKVEQITHGQPMTVEFDWQSNSQGQRMTFAELKQRRGQQLRQRLGIASYSGLFSFLYITPLEVRHEILVPLLTLESWVPIARKDPDYLEIEEQSAAKVEIAKFFRERATVTINHQSIPAELSRLNFFGLDITDFALNAEPRRVSVHQARVGVILTYKCPIAPTTVTASWNSFVEAAPYLQTVILIGHQPPERFTFQKDATEFTWSGQLPIPQVKPVPIVDRNPSVTERATILEQLLTNVYRAFEQRDDAGIYDALATSAGGNLLRELYLKIKRSLIVAEQGGALSHVTSVKVLSVGPPGNRSSEEMDVAWQVTGTTEHWGHLHTTTSEYRAQMTLAVDDGRWKLKTFQLRSEKRLQLQTSIRGDDQNQ